MPDHRPIKCMCCDPPLPGEPDHRETLALVRPSSAGGDVLVIQDRRHGSRHYIALPIAGGVDGEPSFRATLPEGF